MGVAIGIAKKESNGYQECAWGRTICGHGFALLGFDMDHAAIRPPSGGRPLAQDAESPPIKRWPEGWGVGGAVGGGGGGFQKGQFVGGREGGHMPPGPRVGSSQAPLSSPPTHDLCTLFKTCD